MSHHLNIYDSSYLVVHIRKKKSHLKCDKRQFFLCCVLVMKRVQNLKSLWRTSQNYFILVSFPGLYS